VEYFELLADIEQRLQTRPKGAPPVPDGVISRISEHDTSGSAILLNKADVAIAAMAYTWEGALTCVPGTNPSVLLPFGRDERGTKVDDYWNTIFPGSKRLMTCDGEVYGDNTDVRSPAADELSRGGGWISAGGGRRPDRPKPTKLTLDGVFFVDGGFAGPNQLGSWEHTVCAAEAYLACAALAKEARGSGMPPAEFFAHVQTLTGQPDAGSIHPPRPYWRPSSLDPEAIRKSELQMAGWQVVSMRRSLGDDATLARVAAWADAPVRKFHKL
jgi:hypothetical protein